MGKKLYIYDRVDELVPAYHEEGALVIITAGNPQEALSNNQEVWIKRDPHPWLPTPTRVIDVADSEEDAVYVFPDSGCC